jgi:acyl-CoA thioesterase-1
LKLSAFLILIAVTSAFFTFSCTKPKKELDVNSEQEQETTPVSEDQDNRPIIVAFGNSLTAGRGVDPTQSYPSKLQAKIDANGYRYRVLNAGVSGETSSQGVDRAAAYNYPPPAVAIVELGANDGLRGLPVENTRRNLAAIVWRFQSMGAEVIVAGMEMPPNYGPQYTDSFRKIFQSVAKEYNAFLIPFFLEGVGGHSHLNQEDGIHPTAEGYDIVVENVWKVLEPLLQKQQSQVSRRKSSGGT